MACEGNYNKIPINIDKSEIIKLSKNLSRFTYDFKGVSKINIMSNTISGMFELNYGMQKAVAHMPTLGKLDFYSALFYMNSVNKYNGKHVDMEIILIFVNKNNKMLLIFIPIKKDTTTAKSANFFNQFVSSIEPNVENQEISVNNFNINHIIPQDSFISYKSKAPYLGNCTTGFNLIFFEKTLNIKTEDYDKLVKIFGKNDYKKLNGIEELNNTTTNSMLNVKNYQIKNINHVNASFDFKGTKNGPGLRTNNETLPLVCTPVEDENGEPISGKTRLDWIKGSFDSISPDAKNIFYLIIVVCIIIGAMVFLHSFIFKNLGKILGDESIVTRSSSLT